MEKQAGDLPPSYSGPSRGKRQVCRAASQQPARGLTETLFCSGSTLWATTTVQSTQRFMDLTETETEELTTK